MKMKTLLLTLITSISLIGFSYADSKIEEFQLELNELMKELPPIVDLVIDNSAAEIAGIKSKDKFLRVDGVQTNTWDEWRERILKSPNHDLQMQVERNKKIINLVLTPKDIKGIGRAGVVLFIPNELYRKSAEKGNTVAQNKLGNIYRYGYGVTKDYKKSFNWYKRSAEKGHPEGQYNLGLAYLFGYGVAIDNQKAYNWLLKADKQGNESASWILGSMYLSNEYGFSQDYNKAFYWFKKGSDRGSYNAQYLLGKLYYLGNGVEKSYKEAFSLFQLSAFYSNGAKGQLAVMYAEGKGVSKDLPKAKELLQEIFNNGSKYDKNRAKKAWEKYNLWEF
jgi:hypothetical protein